MTSPSFPGCKPSQQRALVQAGSLWKAEPPFPMSTRCTAPPDQCQYHSPPLPWLPTWWYTRLLPTVLLPLPLLCATCAKASMGRGTYSRQLEYIIAIPSMTWTLKLFWVSLWKPWNEFGEGQVLCAPFHDKWWQLMKKRRHSHGSALPSWQLELQQKRSQGARKQQNWKMRGKFIKKVLLPSPFSPSNTLYNPWRLLNWRSRNGYSVWPGNASQRLLGKPPLSSRCTPAQSSSPTIPLLVIKSKIILLTTMGLLLMSQIIISRIMNLIISKCDNLLEPWRRRSRKSLPPPPPIPPARRLRRPHKTPWNYENHYHYQHTQYSAYKQLLVMTICKMSWWWC